MIPRKSFLEQSSQRITRLSATRRYSLIDEKEWEWRFLRSQCKLLELEQFYQSYMQRLRMGYLKLFIIMELLLMGVHCIVLLSMISDFNRIANDISAYVITALIVWGLLALNFKEKLIEDHPWVTYLTSCLAVAILAMMDMGITIYHAVTASELLTPFFDSFILHAIYMFIPLASNAHAFMLGIIVTVLYLLNYAFVTYSISSAKAADLHISKVISEAIFLMAINFLGVYYRLVREEAIRITFLDRHKYVEESVALRYAREEEQRLLLNIMPVHIVDKIEHHVKSVLQYEIIKIRPIPWRICQRKDLEGKISSWRQLEREKLFIESHDNVTILYADLVNYTHLTTTLDVKTLVETLHDLFVEFDAASEDHNVLRIKFLGDCYYAVAGVAKPNKHHAKSCVDLGLRMIKIIRDVRKRRKLNMDMRIGVHTGSILSGVIGSRKLQYDIWSNDVDIASHLEKTGRAGRVHLSEKTLKQLKGEYRYQQGTRQAKRDPLLLNFGIRTFFIRKPRLRKHINYKARVRHFGISERKIGFRFGPATSMHFMQPSFGQSYSNLIQIHAEEEMAQELKKMPLGRLTIKSCGSDCTKRLSLADLEEEETTMCLFFEEWHCETHFLEDPDDMLKYTVIVGIIIFLTITTMNLVNKPQSSTFWSSNAIFIAVLITFLFLTWFKKLWIMTFTESINLEPDNFFILFLFNVSKHIQSCISTRVIIYLSIIGINFSATLLQLLDYDDCLRHANKVPRYIQWQDIEFCFNPWGITECMALTICMTFIFPRIPFFVKLGAGLIISASYSIIIYVYYSLIYEAGPSTNVELEAKYCHIMVIVLTFVIFYLMDRQNEFIAKVDYDLKSQLLQKQEDAEMTNAYIKMLVNNILPSHVADVYISQQITDELYYEECDNVAVMFACIQNYNIERHGLFLLNDIICAFDEVVKKFEEEGVYKVEKIKVAGWNYISACGLDVARFENVYSNGVINTSYDPTNIKQGVGPSTSKYPTNERKRFTINFTDNYTVLVMARFALQLMKTMHDYNEANPHSMDDESNYGMLRIGMSNGAIMAGVIGLSKPHYDIWGDCVNMASRMAFTGLPGSIQVTKHTAKVLSGFNIQCDFRDMTYVKGRGRIPTYFVGVDENFNFISTTNRTIYDI